MFNAVYILETLAKYQLTTDVWVYFWGLLSVLLLFVFSLCYYHTVWITVALLYFSNHDFFHFVLVQNSFDYLGSFVVPYEVSSFCLCFCKKKKNTLRVVKKKKRTKNHLTFSPQTLLSKHHYYHFPGKKTELRKAEYLVQCYLTDKQPCCCCC